MDTPPTLGGNVFEAIVQSLIQNGEAIPVRKNKRSFPRDESLARLRDPIKNFQFANDSVTSSIPEELTNRDHSTLIPLILYMLEEYNNSLVHMDDSVEKVRRLFFLKTAYDELEKLSVFSSENSISEEFLKEFLELKEFFDDHYHREYCKKIDLPDVNRYRF